ncbi:MAG: radical SAM protein [Rhodospirillaceae bacterium]
MPRLSLWTTSVRRRVKRAGRTLREARTVAQALQSRDHPVLAHLVVTRRCNLACAYCNEFDHDSVPIPTPVLRRRIDRLAEFGTTIIAFSGGEPLLHPDVAALVAHVRSRGVVAATLTNGLLLSRDRIRQLNGAGLDYLQISIDNVEPDSISKKSLSLLDRRLADLAALAEFQVTINSVVGAGTGRAEDAYEIALRARRLGFASTVGVVHDGHGQMKPLADEHREVIDRILQLSPSMFSFAQSGHFQENIIRGLPNAWRCRAGGRYLYVCEDGRVHHCSQRRGRPGIPLDACSKADLVREGDSAKPCAPYCTVTCVHQVALLDSIRERPAETLSAMIDERKKRDPGFEVPMLVTVLSRALLNPRGRALADRVTRMLGPNGRAGRSDAPPAPSPARKQAD